LAAACSILYIQRHAVSRVGLQTDVDADELSGRGAITRTPDGRVHWDLSSGNCSEAALTRRL
jgi:hypothetical protein